MARDRLRERVVLLEEFDAFLRLLTGTADPPAPNKLRVYLVHGGLEMSLVAPVGPGVGGFYRASVEGVALVADEYTNSRQNEDDTLLHEYAHHSLMPVSSGALPDLVCGGVRRLCFDGQHYAAQDRI